MVICGLISQFTATPPAPCREPYNFAMAISKRLKIRGLRATDYGAQPGEGK